MYIYTYIFNMYSVFLYVLYWYKPTYLLFSLKKQYNKKFKSIDSVVNSRNLGEKKYKQITKLIVFGKEKFN